MDPKLLNFGCPSCAVKLKIKAELAGKRIKCPRCANLIVVPAAKPDLTGTTGGGSLPAPAYDFLTAPQQPDEMGRLAQYRVLRVLGEGGMGVVFCAEDTLLNRSVALKVIRPGLGGEAVKARFLREARAAAAVEHDHVVAMFQVGEANGVPFLSMPLLQGESLEQRLNRETKLPLPEILRIGREMAEGLNAAHEKGLIHRDVKPANVWLEGKRGRVKLLDFGLARATGNGDAQLTQEGAIVGTPAYMAPEQGRGETVDARCDLFSLGCVLYRLTTGEPPFGGGDAISTLICVASVDPPAPHTIAPEVPRELSALIMRLLEKQSERRPGSAQEVVQVLEKIAPTEQLAVSKKRNLLPPTEEMPAQPVKRKRRLAVVVVTGLILLLGLGLTLFALTRKPEADTPSKPEEQAALPWEPGPAEDVMPGFVSRPTAIPGVKRWQVVSVSPRKGTSVAWGPDGKLLAWGDTTGIIRLYDADTLRLVQILVGHTSDVLALTWSPDGSWLASGGADATVRLWRPDGTPGEILKDPSGGVRAISWSPDSKRLVSTAVAFGTPFVRVWRTDGKPGPTLKGVWEASWSPDGRRIASADMDQPTIRLWDPTNGTTIESLGPLPHRVRFLAWSPDGKKLGAFAAGLDKDKAAGYVWDMAEPMQKLSLEPPTNPSNWINWVGWSKDGKLAVATHYGNLRVYDPDRGKILTTTADRGVRGSPLSYACWSPNGAEIAEPSGRIWKWDADRVQLLPSRQLENSGDINLDVATWSPTGQHLVIAGRTDNQIRVWKANGRLETVFKGHEAGVYWVHWRPDGQRLASCGGDNMVRLWEPNGKPGPVLKGHTWTVHQLAWSPDGKRLASASFDKTVRLWEADGTPGPILQGHIGRVTAVAWSPNGKRLASGSSWGETAIRLWEVDGTAGPIIQTHETSGVGSVCWSPLGKYFASSGWLDGTVRLWKDDGSAGPILKHDHQVGQVGWTPDGKYCYSVGGGTVRLWNVDGTQVSVLKGYQRVISVAGWSPDGKFVGTAGWEDGTVLVTSADGTPIWSMAMLGQSEVVSFSPAGEVLHGDPKVMEKELVYLVENQDGRVEKLKPSEFRKRVVSQAR